MVMYYTIHTSLLEDLRNAVFHDVSLSSRVPAWEIPESRNH